MMCLTASASHTGHGTDSRCRTPRLTCTTPVLAPTSNLVGDFILTIVAELPLVYVAWALTTLFLRSSGQFNTDPACRNRCVGQTLTVSFSLKYQRPTIAQAVYAIRAPQSRRQDFRDCGPSHAPLSRYCI